MKTRAAVAYRAGAPLVIETVDLDGPKAGEVLVEIRATGVCHTDAFTRLMAFQVERAEARYASALALLPAEDARAQRPGLVMAAIYRTLLAEIRSDGYRVLDHRVALTPIRKLWIAWKTWITA